MKRLGLLLSLALLPAFGVRAQDPTPTPTASPTPSVSTPMTAAAPEKGGHGAKRREMMASLTPEERAKLKEAREAAKEDPAVKAAKADRKSNPKEFRKIYREAMLRKDPSVGAILDKMKSERKADKVF